MDFSSELAKLQRSANAASSQQQPNNNNNHHHRSDPQRRSPPRKRPRHHRARWNENAMRRSLESIRPYRPIPPPAAASPDDRAFHIALLSITIDDLNYEHIWKEWISSNNNTNIHVSLICHAKYPNKVKSKWLKQRLLVDPPKMGRGTDYAPPRYHSRCPEWGSIEITRAMLDLLAEGLLIGNGHAERDMRFSTNRYVITTNHKSDAPPPVDKFVYISETCLPIVSLDTLCQQLSATPNVESWVNARNKPNNGYSRQLQFDKIHPVIRTRWKADQWMVLSRVHAQVIMDMDRRLLTPLWECFVDTKASDELYFPTALCLAGILTYHGNDEIKRRCVTYADWSESAKNPASFYNGKSDLARVAKLAKEEGCLLARKFTLSSGRPGDAVTGEISVEDWNEIVLMPSRPASDDTEVKVK